MRKPWSLTGREQFTAVFRQGRPYSGRLVVVRVLSTGRDTSRLGLVVGKKVGGAVQRNRAKRLIREAVNIRTLATGWDVVVIARPGLQSAKYRIVEQELQGLLLKAGIAHGGRVGGGRSDTHLSEDDL
jgi:ribonuclease P protein component